MRCSNSGEGQWGVFSGVEVRNEVSTIKTSHRMTNEVHPAADCLALEEIVECLGS